MYFRNGALLHNRTKMSNQKKVRTRTLKDKTETEIQREICDWLNETGFFFWRSNNVPVYAKSNDGKMRFRALPKYTPKGLPDITIIYKGIPVFLEVKRNSKLGLSKDQEIISQKIKNNGGLYYTVWDLLSVKRIMSQLTI